MSEVEVIYIDNHLLVLHKRAGQLSQGDATGDESLLDAAKAWLKREYKKPGNVFLGLVHHTDGTPGTLRRLQMARKHASRFGIATECGFGRRPPETMPALLRIHREVALRL